MQTFSYVLVYFTFLAWRARCASASCTMRAYCIAAATQICIKWLSQRHVPSACVRLCRSGKVTNEMLTAPSKWRFGLIGACEAIAQVLGFLSASHLPGKAHAHPLRSDSSPGRRPFCNFSRHPARSVYTYCFVYLDCHANAPRQLIPIDHLLHQGLPDARPALSVAARGMSHACQRSAACAELLHAVRCRGRTASAVAVHHVLADPAQQDPAEQRAAQS